MSICTASPESHPLPEVQCAVLFVLSSKNSKIVRSNRRRLSQGLSATPIMARSHHSWIRRVSQLAGSIMLMGTRLHWKRPTQCLRDAAPRSQSPRRLRHPPPLWAGFCRVLSTRTRLLLADRQKPTKNVAAGSGRARALPQSGATNRRLKQKAKRLGLPSSGRLHASHLKNCLSRRLVARVDRSKSAGFSRPNSKLGRNGSGVCVRVRVDLR